MRLNSLHPAKGSKPAAKRVGRGIGSGLGKTCGKGHKGQRARSGGYHKVGFEGGQTPIHRRLPKFGFVSRKAPFVQEMRLSVLEKLDAEVIDQEVLRSKKLIGHMIKEVKIILDRPISKKIIVQGIKVSAGAKSAIESAGGKIEG